VAIDSLAGAELPIPRPALARRSLNNDIVVPMLPAFDPETGRPCLAEGQIRR